MTNLRSPLEIALFGDSLAASWPLNVLGRIFPGMRIGNFAVGGDQVQNTLWMVSRPEMHTISPATVVVLTGTNNLAGDPACAIAAGLEAVIEKATLIWPRARVYVFGIPPRGAGYSFRNVEREATNSQLMKFTIDLRSNVVMLDIDQVISCKFTQPCPNYHDDQIHLTRTGYSVLSESLRQAVHP